MLACEPFESGRSSKEIEAGRQSERERERFQLGNQPQLHSQRFGASIRTSLFCSGLSLSSLRSTASTGASPVFQSESSVASIFFSSSRCCRPTRLRLVGQQTERKSRRAIQLACPPISRRLHPWPSPARFPSKIPFFRRRFPSDHSSPIYHLSPRSTGKHTNPARQSFPLVGLLSGWHRPWKGEHVVDPLGRDRDPRWRRLAVRYPKWSWVHAPPTPERYHSLASMVTTTDYCVFASALARRSPSAQSRKCTSTHWSWSPTIEISSLSLVSMPSDCDAPIT